MTTAPERPRRTWRVILNRRWPMRRRFSRISRNAHPALRTKSGDSFSTQGSSASVVWSIVDVAVAMISSIVLPVRSSPDGTSIIFE